MGYLALMYLGSQATLDEIMVYFPNHNIYTIDSDFVVVVAPNGNVCATFESIGYEDDDCVPDVYELYDTNYDNVNFAEVAHLWGNKITKIQGGIK